MMPIFLGLPPQHAISAILHCASLGLRGFARFASYFGDIMCDAVVARRFCTGFAGQDLSSHLCIQMHRIGTNAPNFADLTITYG